MVLPHAVDSSTIILATLNAKYIHASLGLRYLLANMARHGGADLRQRCVLREFTIARKPQEIMDELLAVLGEPKPGAVQVVGFGVYIWNVLQTTAVLRLLKAARPDIKVVLGGPEVSHEVEEQEIVRLADFVITGWGDVSFPKLCRALLHGPQPLMKVIAGEQPPLDQMALPYAEYTDADLAHRLLYVEASRGCPFKCEFCLSSLDKTAWAFDLEVFLAEMQVLHQRGARNFKFVDRTFNLKIDASVRILQFFLDRLSDDLFVHFEVIPDQLPDRLKAMIAQFPPGVLQLEVGVQSFNVEVQQRISRKQDNERTEANLRWLVNASNAHLHTDLIFGLPGETLASFSAGFDRLHALGPHEIQLGVLKRLRGTPIARHTVAYGMVYDPDPPYTVRQTGAVDAATMQRFTRFSRYWDLVANSGRFKQTLPLLLGVAPSPFDAFLGLADWLWQTTGTTSGLSPEALVDALFDYLSVRCGLPAQTVRQTLLADFLASGARASPRALKGLLPKQTAPISHTAKTLAQRQERHLPVPPTQPQQT
ncbi:B12-binding domain-containing radical SAM protein [Rhodoferax sp. UBA5149]|uniref:B12-binding domain-containing radical SAM protein n=1 Tax=Rhodoferax sp. UBA5149 TaxID=1947379 RepID=UPI0025EFB536|nr:B12-binding domain-containing radical SAM protein [Rhodoferax sp. UBA5149]